MSIFDFFRGGKKPPTSRLPVKGLRGTGGKSAPTAQPYDRWAGLTEEESQSFLSGDPMVMHSSCIGLAQYTAGHLMIEFYDEATGAVTGKYLYLDVPKEMVVKFLQAGSKGAWVSVNLVQTKWPYRKL
jgi:hypothetical protein